MTCKPQSGSTREEALLKVIGRLEDCMRIVLARYQPVVPDGDGGWATDSDADNGHGGGGAERKKRKYKEDSARGKAKRTKRLMDKSERQHGKSTETARQSRGDSGSDGREIDAEFEFDDKGNLDQEALFDSAVAGRSRRRMPRLKSAPTTREGISKRPSQEIPHHEDDDEGMGAEGDVGAGQNEGMAPYNKKKGKLVSDRNREKTRGGKVGYKEDGIQTIDLRSDSEDGRCDENGGKAGPSRATAGGGNGESRHLRRREGGKEVRDEGSEMSRD